MRPIYYDDVRSTIYSPEIKQCLKYELMPAAYRNSYICPLCGSGNYHRKGTVHLYDEGQRWKCFNCKRGGDIFDLLEARDDLTPEEARKEVLARYGRR